MNPFHETVRAVVRARPLRNAGGARPRRHLALRAVQGAFLGLAAAVGLACTPAPTGPRLPEAELRVLFIGNSLTFTEDVPRLVQTLADAAGRSMSYSEITRPNFSLEDHWRTGAAEEIRRLAPDVVIMQQGPSSLPASREHLVRWSAEFDTVIREAGGVPALFMVWPDETRKAFFSDVRDSYAAAAERVHGMLIPAGVTWLEVWAREPEARLYGPDGFHQSYLGALAAAGTIYAVLFDVPASDVPALPDGVDPRTRAILAESIAASVAEWGRRGE